MAGHDRGQSSKAKNQEMAKHLIARGFWHGKRPNSPYPNSGGTPSLNASGSSKAQRRSPGTYSSAQISTKSTSPKVTPKLVDLAEQLLAMGLSVDYTGEVYEADYNVTTEYVNGVPVRSYRPHQTWDYSFEELEAIAKAQEDAA